MTGNSLFGQRLMGYPVDPREHIDIDTAEDWDHAERLFEERRLPLTF
jgi:hypothetical protein